MHEDQEDRESGPSARGPNRYTRIVSRIFEERYKPGATEVPFSREDIVDTARSLDVKLPKNLGDVLYSFRFRTELPSSITNRAPTGKVWIDSACGQRALQLLRHESRDLRAETPGPALPKSPIRHRDSSTSTRSADEQALLARVRYNRMVDVFTGITCYSLQSHLRTTVEDLGQIETDEVYVGCR